MNNSKITNGVGQFGIIHEQCRRQACSKADLTLIYQALPETYNTMSRIVKRLCEAH